MKVVLANRTFVAASLVVAAMLIAVIGCKRDAAVPNASSTTAPTASPSTAPATRPTAQVPAGSNKPAPRRRPRRRPAQAQAPTGPKADFILDAEDLLDDLKQDSDATSAKYNGKKLKITGVIGGLSDTSSGSAIVRLGGGPTDGIECWLNDKNPWGKLAIGQKIAVLGKADLGSMKHLSECDIVEMGPSTAINVAAGAMVLEYKANPEAFAKGYTGKTVVVDGEVVKKEPSGGSLIVWLKGTADLNVGTTFTTAPADKDATDKIRIGDRVKITGTVMSTPTDGKWIAFAKRVGN